MTFPLSRNNQIQLIISGTVAISIRGFSSCCRAQWQRQCACVCSRLNRFDGLVVNWRSVPTRLQCFQSSLMVVTMTKHHNRPIFTTAKDFLKDELGGISWQPYPSFISSFFVLLVESSLPHCHSESERRIGRWRDYTSFVQKIKLWKAEKKEREIFATCGSSIIERQQWVGWQECVWWR